MASSDMGYAKQTGYTLQLYERSGKHKLAFLKSPLFLAVLFIKLLVLIVLEPHIVSVHYAPLVQYFLASPTHDPYSAALVSHWQFPYPSLMLYVLAIPQALMSIVGLAGSATLRIPVILADVTILIVLSRWLRGREEQVLLYYWCSPALFLINYVAGYLDIIPVGFLFVAFYALFKERYQLAALLLGCAIATKTGLAILLPFVVSYWYMEGLGLRRILRFIFLAGAVYAICNALYLTHPAFWHVISSGSVPLHSGLDIHFGTYVLYALPLLYGALVVWSTTFLRLHQDLFLMFMGASLSLILLVAVPEMGWYAWVLPFLAYFVVRETRAGMYAFVLLQLSFLVYFLTIPTSPLWSTFPTLFASLSGILDQNLSFTALQGTLLFSVVGMYRLGILGNTQRKLLYHPFVLGVAGDSATGKSTIVELLLKVLGVRNVLEIAGDDMHKWERGDPNWEKFTHLNPLANRLHDDMDHIARLKKNQVVRRRFYDHTTGRFTEPQRIAPKKMIVYQGLHALYLDRARSLIDLKIFLLPDEALRRQWKVDRDTAARGHTIERVLKQMDDRVEDAEKYIAKQREHADLTFSFTGSGDERMLQVLCSNSLPLDELIEVLNSVGLVTTHEHHEGKQLVTIKGVARADQIEMVAYGIVPWVWDINRERVTWESGLSGVMQLLILYAVTHNMQFEYGYTY